MVSTPTPIIRRIREEEIPEAIALSDRTFRDAEQLSMGKAYPHAFSSSLKQSFGCFVDGRLVSFIGLVPSVVRIGPAALNVYSIGSVCTDPAHRGNGYAGRMLQHIVAHGRKAGASLMLISGYDGIYGRAGSHRFGDIERFALDAASARRLHAAADPAGRLRLRELDSADWFAVKHLADARAVRFEQSVWDIASLIQASAMASNGKLRHQVWVAEDDKGVQAYAVLAVPGDVKPKGARCCAVEWGGEPLAVVALLAHGFAEAKLAQLNVQIPVHERELAQVLHDAGISSESQPQLGTILVVDAAALYNQLAPYWQSIDPAAFSMLKVEQAPASPDVMLTWDNVEYRLSGPEWISLLFDRQPNLSSFTAASDKEWQALFPVPFPSPSGLNYV